MDNSRAFTLIELLVVIAIISLLSLVGFVNFKSFSADQVAIKAAGQIQSILRLAQTNASTSTNCNGSPQTNGWSVDLNSALIVLNCNGIFQKSYVLDNVQITLIDPPIGCSSGPSFTLTYSISTGALTLPCSASISSVTFKVQHSSDPTKSKTLTVTKGGAINVQ